MINSYFKESSSEQLKRLIAVYTAIDIIKLTIQSTTITRSKDFDSVLDSIYDNIEHIADSIQDSLEQKK